MGTRACIQHTRTGTATAETFPGCFSCLGTNPELGFPTPALHPHFGAAPHAGTPQPGTPQLWQRFSFLKTLTALAWGWHWDVGRG